MTKSTDSRQLRLLIDGVLSAYGIDNLELSIRLTDGVKKMIGADLPVKTREDYLKGIERSIQNGAAKHEQLAAIATEIETRTLVTPSTKEWQDFIELVWQRQRDKGETISKFLDWWLSDDWQRAHPPSRPDSWIVKWKQAFATVNPAEPERPELKKYVPEEGNYVARPENLPRPNIHRSAPETD